MESVRCSDKKAARGVDFLKGKSDERAGWGKQDGIDKDTRSAGLADSRRGLDLGRRALVVVKPGSGAGARGKPWATEGEGFGVTPALTLQDISRQKHGKHESTVHIIDHGDSQREAVRRLFDAQVLLQSYEMQLKEREDEVKGLRAVIKEAAAGAGLSVINGVARGEPLPERPETAYEQPPEPEPTLRRQTTRATLALDAVLAAPMAGLSPKFGRATVVAPGAGGDELRLVGEGVPAGGGEERPPPPAETAGDAVVGLCGPDPAAGGGGGAAAKGRGEGSPSATLPATSPSPDESKMFKETTVRLIAAGSIAPPNSRAELIAAGSPDAGAAQAAAEKGAPAADLGLPVWMTNDPASRALVEACRKDMLAMEGSLDAGDVAQSLWQVCVKFSARWNYDPNGTLTKRNEELQKRVAQLQADSLRESSQLHMHIKKIEKRFAELQAHAHELERAPHVGHAMTRHRPSLKPAGSSTRTTTVAGGSGHNFYPHGNVGHVNTGDSDAGGHRLESAGGGAGGAMSAVDTSGSFGGIGKALQSSLPLHFAPLERTEPVPRLEDDECIRYNVVPAQLEEMDHEIFEPINSFDKDQRELLIDIVNEKVRRILTLDTSKWQNGKLPFGLLPDNKAPDVATLEAELASLKHLLKSATDEINDLKNEILSLKGKIETQRQTSKQQASFNRAAAKDLKEKSPRVPDKEPPCQSVDKATSPAPMESPAPMSPAPMSPAPMSPAPMSPARGRNLSLHSDDDFASGQMSPTTAAAFAGMTEAERKLHTRIKELEDMLKNIDKKDPSSTGSDNMSSQRALELATEALMRQAQVMHKVLKKVTGVVDVSRTVKEQKADEMMKKMGKAAEAVGGALPLAPDSYDWRQTAPGSPSPRSRGRPSPAPKAAAVAAPVQSSGAPTGAARTRPAPAPPSAASARPRGSPGEAPGGQVAQQPPVEPLQLQNLQASPAGEPEAEPTSQHPPQRTRSRPRSRPTSASVQPRESEPISMPELMSDLSAEERIMYQSGGSSIFTSRPISGAEALNTSVSSGFRSTSRSASPGWAGAAVGVSRRSRGGNQASVVASESTSAPRRASVRRRHTSVDPGEGGVEMFHNGTQPDPCSPTASPSAGHRASPGARHSSVRRVGETAQTMSAIPSRDSTSSERRGQSERQGSAHMCQEMPARRSLSAEGSAIEAGGAADSRPASPTGSLRHPSRAASSSPAARDRGPTAHFTDGAGRTVGRGPAYTQTDLRGVDRPIFMGPEPSPGGAHPTRQQESGEGAGDDDGGTQPPLESAISASTSLELWHGEAMDNLEGRMAELMAEMERLRAQNQALQDENSRMLLMMDEMRGRMEKLGGHSAEVDDALEKTGLKGLVNPGGKERLKDVFSRLYQDGVQRVQRYCLIRSQMLSATSAATEMVSTLSHKTEVDRLGEDVVPDLGRLSATACAALNGMWYTTDYLFRRACAYAMAQGVDSVGKLHASAVSELMEESGSLTGLLTKRSLGVDGDPFNRSRKRGARHLQSRCPPCRHGGRPVEPPECPQPESAMRSPRKIRQEAVVDPEPTDFTVYVAGIKEARNDLRPNEWPRLEQYPSGKQMSNKGMPLNGSAPLNGTSSRSRGATSGKRVISGSQSLPAIPKSRPLL